jgi:hypothetical protein
MKQELKTQYLHLKLKVSLMVARLQENEGKIAELERSNSDLQAKARIARSTQPIKRIGEKL